ncbi:hypothetical protein L1987_31174 [Smallanthus sonchifolius]|uniref:Uncharacterized protein n=1 Tax=Smallanthus sonchifolius TaxID=185202 RepID=A0ACB9I654_9ASTR|nr:hypothetical protein L1987_31174 [Smallanthus sonchifolius]
MAGATKFIIAFALLSLVFLVIFLSPINHIHNYLSISNLTSTSTSRLLQDEAVPKIKNNDITLARIEEQLTKALGEIHKAIVEKSLASSKPNGSYIGEETIYKNPFAFFHVEGDFIEEMERKGNPMVARDPDEAHAFFIPIITLHRSILAFFAGGIHGFVRERLFQYWGNKEDDDIQVYNYVPKGRNYTELLTQSKYCLCPSGYEVATSRLTEAIYTGCIPLIIKDHYVLPYSDVWSQFSIQVAVDKIPEIKRSLHEIPFSKTQMIREEQKWPRAATKFVIAFALLSLVFLVTSLSPTNHIHNYLSISNLRSTSTSRLLQDEAVPKIKNNDITLARVEEQLAKARGEIHKAIVEKSLASSNTNGSYIREGTIYKNPFAFFQSHIEMIKTFKIWTYKEGEIPLVHNGPMKYVYSVEGDFIEEMERKGNPMAARHPDEAHAFFIPISITNIIYYLFKPDEAIGFKHRIEAIVEDYVGVIAERYPYWNRSNGADHFFVSCHDWGPSISLGNPKLFKNFIRVLCNANRSEGFVPIRDVSMSEINGPFDNIPHASGGQSPYNRSILAVFSGKIRGYIRERLFQYWGNKQDNDIQVSGHLPKGKNYTELLSQSKYCLCPSGFEVASSRTTDAIYTGCVPVIIKDHYVLPYSDVLDWSQFSVQVPVDKIPEIKRILQEISFSKYLEMQKKVIEVQRHFMVNLPAKHFDVLHMILHSVWLRRLNVQLNSFNST